jgi:alanine-glyoxylate transaminase/serine-glyoxylate transaminase/serine-pyruvate transaminase
MLEEEGLQNVFARHNRHAEATRRAVREWGLEILCANPIILENFNLSLDTGLGKVKGKIFRIGLLGDFNDLILAGALAGVEMGFSMAAVPFSKGGTMAALDYLGKARKA